MIYLDYAANTPVAEEVLKVYYEECRQTLANPNSKHRLGVEAKEKLDGITGKIADLLGVKPAQIIYTSGASEANNLAIKGLAYSNRQKGKHIISTCLEHPSVSGALTYLQDQGYEIDLVELTGEGLVDLHHLRELLRKDTILVSICAVDSELGIRQQLPEIGAMLKEYPNCCFHTDATQAVGKIEFAMDGADCITFAPHKFYGLNSCGFLIKREGITLEPLIHGGSSTTLYRSGTPDLPMAAAACKALELALEGLEERYAYIKELNQFLKQSLSSYRNVRINSTGCSIPHILNLSVQGVKAVQFTKALEEEGVCVSIKSACSVLNSPSRPVYAITKDKKNAMSSWRISLSHLTAKEELEAFLQAFDHCYQRLSG
jgi:cysteine desulfurase